MIDLRGLCWKEALEKRYWHAVWLDINLSNAIAKFVQGTRMQRFFRKSSKPCQVGIHWVALAEFF